MQAYNFSDKEKSQMTMWIYFPELYPNRSYIPYPSGAPKIPKEMEDMLIKNITAFIQLN